MYLEKFNIIKEVYLLLMKNAFDSDVKCILFMQYTLA